MEQVTSLRRLQELAIAKKSVVCPDSYCDRFTRPAAFVINMQGMRILMLFNKGMYVYEKEPKNGKK